MSDANNNNNNFNKNNNSDSSNTSTTVTEMELNPEDIIIIQKFVNVFVFLIFPEKYR